MELAPTNAPRATNAARSTTTEISNTKYMGGLIAALIRASHTLRIPGCKDFIIAMIASVTTNGRITAISAALACMTRRIIRPKRADECD